ncbi:hypothetical protein [Sphingomonas sp.]
MRLLIDGVAWTVILLVLILLLLKPFVWLLGSVLTTLNGIGN